MRKKKDYNKPVGILSSFDLKEPKYKIVYAIMFLILTLVTIISILPVIWVVISGFKTTQEIYSSTPSFFPEKFSVDTLIRAWKHLEIGGNIFVTFVIAVGEIAFMVAICGLAGYVLSRLKPVGSRFIFLLVVWTMMLPAANRTVPLYMSIVDVPILHINLTNNYLPLFLMAAGSAFNIMLFKNYFDSISNSLVEAAKIDGCNNLRIFFKIMLPLSSPILIYTCITQFNHAWSNFFMPMLILADERLQPVPTVIYRMKSGSTTPMNIYMLGLFIACVPSIAVFAIFSKKIMGGISVGAVKG